MKKYYFVNIGKIKIAYCCAFLFLCFVLLFAISCKNEQIVSKDSDAIILDSLKIETRNNPTHFEEKLVFLKKFAIERRSDAAMAHYYNSLSYYNLIQGKLDTATYWANNAIKFSGEKHLHTELADAKRMLGRSYMNKRAYNEALHWYQESLSDFEQIKDTASFALCYYDMGLLYDYIYQEDESLKAYETAAKFAEYGKNNWKARLFIEANIGDFSTRRKNYRKTLKHLAKRLDYAKKLNDDIEIAMCQINIYENLQLLDEPVPLDSVLFLAEKMKKNGYKEDPQGYAILMVVISKMLTKAQRYDEAVIYLNHAKEIFDVAQLTKISSVDAYYALFYKSKGDYKKSLQYLESYAAALDSSIANNTQSQINTLRTFYELDKKEQEIQLLAAENKIKQLQLYGLLVGLLLAAGAILAVYGQYRRVKAANVVIEEQATRLSVLMKELHHRVKNNLQIVSSLLNLQSYRISDPEALAAVREGKQRVDAMMYIHQYLYQTDDVSTLDIRAYITNLCERLMQAYGYTKDNFDLKIDLPKAQFKVDNAIPIGLIINELVTNSFKYAYKNVENPSLRIDFKTGQETILTIKDNGRNFDKKEWEQASQSFGKTLVHSLALQIKAKLDLNTDDGTMFSIIFPK
jgi:two-component sensor histidine kinase